MFGAALKNCFDPGILIDRLVPRIDPFWCAVDNHFDLLEQVLERTLNINASSTHFLKLFRQRAIRLITTQTGNANPVVAYDVRHTYQFHIFLTHDRIGNTSTNHSISINSYFYLFHSDAPPILVSNEFPLRVD